MRLALFSLALCSIAARGDGEDLFKASIAEDHPLRQKQFDEYLMGFFDKTEVVDLSQIKKLIWNEEAIDDVTKILDNRGFKTKGVFDILDFEMRTQTTALYKLFSSTNDWNILKKVVAFVRDKVHPEQLRYALATSVFHGQNSYKLSPPNWFEVYPNYLLPAATLRELYRRKMKGVKETVVFVNIANETVHGKNSYFNAFSETDPESRLRYFRDDTGLSNMFINWHLHFPNWRTMERRIDLELWEDRGHLFYYFHQQLLARYNLERINNGLEPVEGLSWDKVEMGRYVLDLLDNDGDPIPGRHAGAPNIQNTWWKRIRDLSGLQHRLSQIVDSNMVLNKYKHRLEPLQKDQEVYQLGNLILGSDNSSHPEYYGSYFFEGTDAVNIMGKGDIADNKEPGFFFKMLTTLRDPLFYSMLENIRTFVQDYTNNYLTNYKDIDETYNYFGLTLDYIKFNNKLETFFEYTEIDVTKVIDLAPDETTDDIKYRAKILKLNHQPFTYTFRLSFNLTYLDTIKNEKPQVMFRLFLGPKFDWRGREMDFQTAKHFFVEIDRHPIQLLTSGKGLGINTATETRHSRDSSLYISGDLNYAKVDDMIRQGRKTKKDWDISCLKNILFCGLPNNIMLPKGEEQGSEYRIIALITPFSTPKGPDSARKFKSFPLCGQAHLMDHWTGFPFDRVASIHDDYFRYPFAIQQDITIYHKATNDSD